MRGGVILLALTMLPACWQEPQPLFTGECNDGSRVAGTKAAVESRCSRLKGVRSLTPLDEVKEPAAAP